jgi:hypothetical protein
MPRQNRVTPFGEVIATEARGMWMGNRGVLHDETGRLVRQRSPERRWITCLLQFKGRRRTLMQPGHYTELFFLDEATAFAAGHRPCAECRRADFIRFREAWVRANLPGEQPGRVPAPAIDARLHGERVGPGGRPAPRVALDALPDGCFVTLDDAPGEAHLVYGAGLLRWTPAGYDARMPRPGAVEVGLLTPPSVAAAFHAGYAPQVHPTATG